MYHINEEQLNHEFIFYGPHRIAYYRFGVGTQWVVCFHGYGQSGVAFECFVSEVGSEYTFIVIDLPQHGHTEWVGNLPMQVSDMMRIIASIIPPQTVFSLMGYSMGARIALCLQQQFPESVKQLILLAPDGLRSNAWQWMSTQTKLGNQLFKYLMLHAQWLPKLVAQMGQWHLLNPSIVRFVLLSIVSKQQRTCLYTRWTTMRLFWPNQAHLRQVLSQYATPIACFLGNHDRIIPAAVITRQLRQMSPQANIQYLPAGHQILKPAFVLPIKAALLP